MLFPGEAEAIKKVKELGSQYGYGNLIFHLRIAWADMLRTKWHMDAEAADTAAGFVCPWCRVDSRTGEVNKSTANVEAI